MPWWQSTSHGARVSAWGKLGESVSLFKQIHEHSGPDKGPMQHEEVRPERDELIERYEGVVKDSGHAAH